MVIINRSHPLEFCKIRMTYSAGPLLARGQHIRANRVVAWRIRLTSYYNYCEKLIKAIAGVLTAVAA
jgi:hypothetical protein